MKGSWKTTLVGLLCAIAIVVIPIIQTGSVTLRDIIIAVCIAVAGYLQKDLNVTGGTVDNNLRP